MKKKENRLIEFDHQLLTADSDEYREGVLSRCLDVFRVVAKDDYHQIKQISDALFDFGQAEQKSFWLLNERMKYPLQKRMAESHGGGKVAQLIGALHVKVVLIKPPKRTFFSTFKSMFKLLFSWHHSAFQVWLENYPKHKQEIANIVSQLEQLKRQLNRDNNMLLGDRKDLEEQLGKLENCFDLICQLEDRLKLDSSESAKVTVGSQNLIQDEFLPPLQQRIIELQQQLLIARQAVMTLELFIHDNESQIRSIDQAIYTTASVIDVTAGIIMAEQGKVHLSQANPQKRQVKTTVDVQKLKQARKVIDNALSQMDETRLESKQSADELSTNSVVSNQN